MVPTADQSQDSISSEKSKDEPATPDDPVFTPEVSLDSTSQTASSPTTVTESSFAQQTEPALSASDSSPTRPAFISSPTSTNRSPIAGISTTTEGSETGQPLIPSSSSALASTSKSLSPSSETFSTPTKTRQTLDYTSISKAWPISLCIGTQAVVEPTSIAPSPTPDQSIGSIPSEATKTEPATPGYSVPKVSLDSTSRSAGSPSTINEDPSLCKSGLRCPPLWFPHLQLQSARTDHRHQASSQPLKIEGQAGLLCPPQAWPWSARAGHYRQAPLPPPKMQSRPSRTCTPQFPHSNTGRCEYTNVIGRRYMTGHPKTQRCQVV